MEDMHFTIRQARKYADYSQAEMAGFLEVDRSTYIRIEKNQSRATVSQIRAISSATGVPLSAFFKAIGSTKVDDRLATNSPACGEAGAAGALRIGRGKL